MVTHIWDDPRRYLLVVIAVALVAIVPLGFGFVTMMPFGTGSAASIGAIVVWALLGMAIGALVVGVIVVLARSTRLEELELEKPGGGDRHEP